MANIEISFEKRQRISRKSYWMVQEYKQKAGRKILRDFPPALYYSLIRLFCLSVGFFIHVDIRSVIEHDDLIQFFYRRFSEFHILCRETGHNDLLAFSCSRCNSLILRMQEYIGIAISLQCCSNRILLQSRIRKTATHRLCRDECIFDLLPDLKICDQWSLMERFLIHGSVGRCRSLHRA